MDWHYVRGPIARYIPEFILNITLITNDSGDREHKSAIINHLYSYKS
jgi:hypothetical protein